MLPRKTSLALSLQAALLLACAAILPGGIMNQDPEPEKAPAARGVVAEIGVVDMSKLRNSYAGAAAKEEEWREMERGFQQRLNELKSKFEELEAARSGYVEGTPEFYDADLQARLKSAEIEGTMERFEVMAKRKQVDIVLELSAELRAGIGAFAKARNLKMVLKSPRINPNSPRVARMEAEGASDLLFYDDALDITDDVIQFLKTWK